MTSALQPRHYSKCFSVLIPKLLGTLMTCDKLQYKVCHVIRSWRTSEIICCICFAVMLIEAMFWASFDAGMLMKASEELIRNLQSMKRPCSVEGCNFIAKNAGVLHYHHLMKHNLSFPSVYPACKARFGPLGVNTALFLSLWLPFPSQDPSEAKHDDLFQQPFNADKWFPQRFSRESCTHTFSEQVSLSKHSALHKVAIVVVLRIHFCLL